MSRTLTQLRGAQVSEDRRDATVLTIDLAQPELEEDLAMGVSMDFSVTTNRSAIAHLTLPTEPGRG